MGNESKVKVTNLAPWSESFARKNRVGEVLIPPNGVIFLERDELEAQCYDNNVQFVGSDGHGAHAQLMFDDEEIHKQFDFPEEQAILVDSVLDKLFAYKQQGTFEKKARELVVREFERHRIVDYIQRKKINDFSKVRFIEDFCGVSVKM